MSHPSREADNERVALSHADTQARAALAESAARARARLEDSGNWMSMSEYRQTRGDTGAGDLPEQLVAVTSGEVVMIPTFQLAQDLGVDQPAGYAIAVLRSAGWTAWEIWDWAETPNAWLAGGSPAAAIAVNDLESLHRALAAAVSDGPDA